MTATDPRCGTLAGHSAHLRRDERPCDPCRLAKGRRAKELRLLAHRGESVYVPSIGARRRIQALQRLGWPLTTIAAEGGWRGIYSIQKAIEGDRVQRKTHDRIVQLYERLSGTPGPSQVAARRAAAKGYAAPLAWDDIDHDTQPAGLRGEIA